MKSRLHYDYQKCPICLQVLDTIFICDFTDKTPFETLMKKKDEFYEDLNQIQIIILAGINQSEVEAKLNFFRDKNLNILRVLVQ